MEAPKALDQPARLVESSAAQREAVDEAPGAGLYAVVRDEASQYNLMIARFHDNPPTRETKG